MNNLNNYTTKNILDICDFINSHVCKNNNTSNYKEFELLENGARTKFTKAIFYDELSTDYLHINQDYKVEKIKMSDKNGDTKTIYFKWCGCIHDYLHFVGIIMKIDEYGGISINTIDDKNTIKGFLSSTIFYEWFINYNKKLNNG